MTDPSASLIARDAAVFLSQDLSSPCASSVRRAEGIWIEDHAGRRFMDFHGNSAHHLGYAHLRILAAIRDQLDQLTFAPRRFACEPATELAEELARIAPGDLGRSLFLPSGSDAVETALRLARAVTGRWKTVSFWGSYHGSGFGAAAVGGDPAWRNRATGPLPTGAEHVAQYDCLACPYNHPGPAACGLACARAITDILRREGDVAAVVAEPMRSWPLIPPAGFWAEVRRACDETGTLLIFDEIPTGLGKTGRMFSSAHEGVVPDIMVLGKALGGAVLPLAAVIARRDLDLAAPWSIGHFTHEKNPVTTRVGLEVLRVIAEEGLVDRSAELGSRALDRLRAIEGRAIGLRHARGRGLLLGIEVTDAVGRPDAARAECIRKASLEAGLNFKLSNGATITLSPPLVIDWSDLDRALSILAAAAGACQP